MSGTNEPFQERRFLRLNSFFTNKERRDRTPPGSYPNFRASYETFKRFIEDERGNGTRKYGCLTAGHSEVRLNGNGRKSIHQPQWRLKCDAAQSRRKYLDQYQNCLQRIILIIV